MASWLAGALGRRALHIARAERLEVLVGDEGTVVVDDSPIEFCVTFPYRGILPAAIVGRLA
jgi:hypothetical protein